MIQYSFEQFSRHHLSEIFGRSAITSEQQGQSWSNCLARKEGCQ
jgi:hypothetical protein